MLFFVIEVRLINKINEYIINVHYSEERRTHIIDINLQVRSLTTITCGFVEDDGVTEGSAKQRLRESADKLQDAQDKLSNKAVVYDTEAKAKINPMNVVMDYKQVGSQLPTSHAYSIREAVMEIVAAAYRLSTTPLQDITDSSSTVQFLITNS